jgi:ferredoxin-thioredoxin reductase catalytic chain
MGEPSQESIEKVERLVENFTRKSGTWEHPDKGITEAVKLGLARNIDDVQKPLCPCRFYPDKAEEVKERTWVCPCSDMQIYKYCHCLLFVDAEGRPVTEYLPEDHDGRLVYGNIPDPSPDKGRALRDRAEAREIERKREDLVEQSIGGGC